MPSSRLPWLLAACAASVSAQSSPPPNDECANAILIANGSYSFDSFHASTSAPPWTCSAAFDVWFLYLASGSGTLSVDTCFSAFDTVLEIFDGAGYCGALTSLGCNDDTFGCGTGSSALSVPVAAGPYFIRVGGYFPGNHYQGTFHLNVNGPYGTGAMAWNTPVGAGCGGRFHSIYEEFDAQSSDLANTTLLWQRTSSGYAISRSAGAQIVPPTAAAVAIATQQLFSLPAPMPVPGGSATALNVTRYGQVEIDAAAYPFPAYQPWPTGLLQQSTSVFACWQNFDTGVGLVTFEIVAGTVYATWNGVTALGAGPSTFQYRFDLATGDVRLAIVAFMLPTFVPSPPTGIVGYSLAGFSVDPGETDLSALTTMTLTTGPEVPALRLDATTRPRLGTSWNLALGSVPPSAVVGFDVFGTTDPGIDDLAAIGMPGCGLRSALDVVLTWPTAGSGHAYSLAIPNTPSLAGARLYTTSAVLTSPPENALGILSANGVEGLLGVL